MIPKIIAIDPGYKKSGVAREEEGEFKEMMSLDIFELQEYMLEHKNYFFLIENSNLINRNWHGATARANVAKNRVRSQDIVEFAKRNHLVFKELKPDGYTQKYSDVDGRFTKFCKQLFLAETKWKGRSNKDSRAAAAMIVVFRKEEKFYSKINKARSGGIKKKR